MYGLKIMGGSGALLRTHQQQQHIRCVQESRILDAGHLLLLMRPKNCQFSTRGISKAGTQDPGFEQIVGE